MRRLMPAVLAIVLALAACSSASTPSPGSAGTKVRSSAGVDPTATTSLETRVARAPAGGAVGYLGCSLTWQTVAGYHDVGGLRMWPPFEGMGEGDIPIWYQELSSPAAPHWTVFDEALATQPVTAFWIEACFLTSQIAPDDVKQAEAVITHIRHAVPGAAIYFSAMNGWDPPESCGKASSAAVAEARRVTDAVVADGSALRGPILPTLPGSETEDGCHPNKAGQFLLGGELLQWLGRS